MNSIAQLELPIAISLTPPPLPRQHIDFPFQAPPVSVSHDLKRVPTRWGRGQTLRSLRLHGMR